MSPRQKLRTDRSASNTGAMADHQEPEDLDRESRNQAMRVVARRAAIWMVPLTVVGALLIGLGIPLWISVGAMVLMLAILVFEVDI